MTDYAYIQYEHHENGEPTGVVARWWGGEYIELGHLDGEEFSAVEVLNVWDYERSEPTIPASPSGLEWYVGRELATDSDLREALGLEAVAA